MIANWIITNGVNAYIIFTLAGTFVCALLILSALTVLILKHNRNSTGMCYLHKNDSKKIFSFVFFQLT